MFVFVHTPKKQKNFKKSQQPKEKNKPKALFTSQKRVPRWGVAFTCSAIASPSSEGIGSTSGRKLDNGSKPWLSEIGFNPSEKICSTVKNGLKIFPQIFGGENSKNMNELKPPPSG